MLSRHSKGLFLNDEVGLVREIELIAVASNQKTLREEINNGVRLMVHSHGSCIECGFVE